MAERSFIIDSARKHGLADEDIWHAYQAPIADDVEQGDGMVKRFGFDRAARLIEVGFVVRVDDVHVIIHALQRRTLPEA